MMLGSLVAGATSEGGGAVAFPVMTLALGVPPEVARDFSFAIQSFGMTVASITIVGLNVPVDVGAIIFSSVGGAIGLLMGLLFVAPSLPPAYAKMFFVSIWVAFAVALYRLNCSDEKRKLYESAIESDEALLARKLMYHKNDATDDTSMQDNSDIESDRECYEKKAELKSSNEDDGKDPLPPSTMNLSNDTSCASGSNSIETIQARARYQRISILIATGFFGGLCTSIAGSGLDMATFSILTLYYRVDEKIATPTSVILMADNAILGLIFRSIGLGGRNNDTGEIWNFVSVCIPIVVIGAPLGATMAAVLFSRNTIARLLYLLDATQFIAALVIVQPWSAKKWSSPNNFWLCLSSALILLLGSLFFFKLSKCGEQRGAISTQH